MANTPWIAIIVLILFIIVSAIAFFASKIRREEYKRTGKHPKGYYIGIWMSIGMAIGMSLGYSIGIAMNNIAFGSIGLGIGVGIGISIGAIFEKKHEHELRPLTKKEIQVKNTVILFLIGTAILGLIVFFVANFLAAK